MSESNLERTSPGAVICILLYSGKDDSGCVSSVAHGYYPDYKQIIILIVNS